METGQRLVRPLALRWGLSVVALAALPAFALFFAGYAETDYDDQVIEAILADAAGDPEAPDAATLAPQLEALRHGGFCAGPDPVLADEVCADYAQFAGARTAAYVALGVSLLALLLALACALAAFLSRTAEVLALRVGWEGLRLLCAAEVILQAGLAVWLSFWVTAILTEKYFIKLILVVGALAAVAVWKVVQAIFRRVSQPGFVSGRRLDAEQCGGLRTHVNQLCEALGTEPPDQIVAGIDDNFFVTEHPLETPERAAGRTHALREPAAPGHHDPRGGERRAGPRDGALRGRGHRALAQARAAAVTLRPVHRGPLRGGAEHPHRRVHGAFRDLVGLAVAQKQREDEFRADRVAAEQTSAEGIGHALVRLAAYSQYRTRVENNLFSASGMHTDLGIAQRVATGFLPFVQTSEFRDELDALTVPHPYDSHPPLQERLAAVGVPTDPARLAEVLQPHTESTWLDEIEGGRDLEQALWETYEARFKQVHEQELAYRYRPDTPEEEAHVLRFFPDVTFDGSGVEVTLTHAEVRIHGEEPLPYREIAWTPASRTDASASTWT
jgi:hypothetical protein